MKVFILGVLALYFLVNLPFIIVGFFTHPLQSIAGLIVCGLMVGSIVKDKS